MVEDPVPKNMSSHGRELSRYLVVEVHIMYQRIFANNLVSSPRFQAFMRRAHPRWWLKKWKRRIKAVVLGDIFKFGK